MTNIKTLKPKTSWILYIFFLILITILSVYLLRINTPLGLGIYPDSVTYITGARNIVGGLGFVRFSSEGFVKPITHYPPFYSILLAGIGMTGLEVVRAARLLNLFLIGLGVLLFSTIIYCVTRDKLLAIIGSLLFLLSSPVFMRYTWALSEPLFFTFLLLSFLIFILFLKSNKSIWIVALGVISALLFLTRYVGIVMAGVWVIMLFVQQPKTNRLRSIVLYLICLLPLIIIQLSRNYYLAGSLTNRDISMLPDLIGKSSYGLSVLESWMVPTTRIGDYHLITMVICVALFGLISAGAIVIGCMLLKRKMVEDNKVIYLTMLLSFFLSTLFYLIGLLFTILFYDSFTQLDSRMLSPLYLLFLCITLSVSGIFIRKGKQWKTSIYFILILFLFILIINLQKETVITKLDGQGYINEKWRASPSINYVNNAEDTVIYTDENAAVYYLTNKVTYQVPFNDPEDTKSMVYYDKMHDQLIKSNGILVLYIDNCEDTSIYWVHLLTRDLRLVERYYDSCVYRPGTHP